jgi:hypothetical protein
MMQWMKKILIGMIVMPSLCFGVRFDPKTCTDADLIELATAYPSVGLLQVHIRAQAGETVITDTADSTATLISLDQCPGANGYLVLASSHAFKNGGWYDEDRAPFTFTLNGQTSNVTGFIPAPLLKGSRGFCCFKRDLEFQSDFGFAILETPITGVASSSLMLTSFKTLQGTNTLTLVGRGYAGRSDVWQEFRSTVPRAIQVLKKEVEDGNVLGALPKSQHPLSIMHEHGWREDTSIKFRGRTTEGDSGGPVFAYIQGKAYVVAVLKCSTSGCLGELPDPERFEEDYEAIQKLTSTAPWEGEIPGQSFVKEEIGFITHTLAGVAQWIQTELPQKIQEVLHSTPQEAGD